MRVSAFFHRGKIFSTTMEWQQFERVESQSPRRRERELERELQRAGDGSVVTLIVSERCRRAVLRRLSRKHRKQIRHRQSH